MGAASSTTAAATASAALATPSSVAAAISLPAVTVAQTILILATSSADANSASSGLKGYGIPWETLIVPQNGAALPSLNSSNTYGNYGGIIATSDLSYSGTGSALTTDQWNTLYAYQIAFGVRLARLDAIPTSDFGVSLAGSCCATGVEQLVSISNSSAFSTANINTGVGLSTQGLYHYPASITNPQIAWEVFQFAPSTDNTVSVTTTAAVINNINGRQQMVFFLPFATQWSETSAFLQHVYIHWLTRGLFVGARKTYFSTQVDDVHLQTAMYSPAGKTFRIGPADLDAHVTWQASLNTRLPSGSNYFLELGHNGNGDIYNATAYSDAATVCDPSQAIIYPAVPTTSLEYQKPVGAGSDVWPSTPASYTWSLNCAELDSLALWFTNAANRDAFSHISHTFTHLYLNNATYADASREITFNKAWLSQLGLDQGRYSPKGIIPPAITGMHNGDAIHAWIDNGVTAVVGDNSRAPLVNSQNEYWPLTTTTANNGYDGLAIVGRWPTRVYYDCDLVDCNVQQWIAIANGTNNWTALLNLERSANVRNLLALRQDPYMFHQANMRAADVPTVTVGSVTGQLSLLQQWVETVTQEMTRLTRWPLETLKQDDLAQVFLDRVTRDTCGPTLSYTYSSDSTQITGVTVSATNLSCGVEIPVTLPGPGTTSASVTVDQVGSEPSIYWISLDGSPVTITLTTPIAV